MASLRLRYLFCVMSMLILSANGWPSEQGLSSADRLTKEEDAAIQRQMKAFTRSELLDVIKTPGSGRLARSRAQYAFTELLSDWCTIGELEILVDIAKTRYDRSIIQRLAMTIYDETATDEEKRRVDRFVDLMEEDIRKGVEATLGPLAVEGLGRTINRSYNDESSARKQGKRPAIPYANARVTDILIDCLDHRSPWVRRRAIYWLGSTGGNDPARAQDVIALLDQQRVKEQNAQDYEERHDRQEVLRTVSSAVTTIRRTMDQDKRAVKSP